MRLSPLRCAELTHTTFRVSHSPPGRRSGGRGLAEPPPAPALSASPCRAAHTGSRARRALEMPLLEVGRESDRLGDRGCSPRPGDEGRGQADERSPPAHAEAPRAPPVRAAGLGRGPGGVGRQTDRRMTRNRPDGEGQGSLFLHGRLGPPESSSTTARWPHATPSGQGRPRLPGPDISCSAGLALAPSRCAGGRGHGESGAEGPHPALASPHPWGARTPTLGTPGGSSV